MMGVDSRLLMLAAGTDRERTGSVKAVHDSSVGPWPFENLVDRYELAYRAFEDALCDPRDRIDEMRGRAITLLSVAVGVLAFLGDALIAGTGQVDPNRSFAVDIAVAITHAIETESGGE